ncbi:DUF4129 domain-containing protein [Microbacterium sp. P5_E9]
MSVASAFRLADAVPPLTPDGEEARRWAQEELADPVYTAAEPTPLDRVARAIGGFFDQLFSSEIPNGWGPTLAVVAALVVIVLIVAAFLIWGLPRASRRTRAAGAELFGVAEERSAARLRRDAASLADRGDWDGAIVLRFRGLARAIVERDLLEVPPGATVHTFARTAGRVFPGCAAALEEAAAAFDDVRYLRRPGTPDLYARVVAVDEAIMAARPLLAESGAVPR